MLLSHHVVSQMSPRTMLLHESLMRGHHILGLHPTRSDPDPLHQVLVAVTMNYLMWVWVYHSRNLDAAPRGWYMARKAHD